MKVENLEVGLVAKNYKEMCEILDDKEKIGSKSKKLQMNRWNCYFNYEKSGHKYIITEIYETVKPLPKRGGNNITPYINQIKELIIQLLLCSGNNKVILPKNRLMVALDMINDNYRIGKENIEGLSKQTSIDKMIIYDFYNSTDGMLANNIEKSLNDLHNKRAIYWSKVYMVNKNNKIDEATDEEYRMIIRVQANILKIMGYEGLLEVFRDGKIAEFTRKTNTILCQEAGIRYIYEAYSINLNKERLEYVVEKMNKVKIKELGKSVNIQIKDRVKLNSTKRHEKTVEKYDEWFGIPDDKKAYRINELFLNKQFILADVLIDIEHPSIF
ncbi:hypothetical protein [Paenibacillus odorifer]|uniref:hypothetical protein n=1 Tax=Paenibacillus odorifer TaxID=189426 RepID=UPI00096E4A45|nr:hypothetical protein [Paenibacillus odorifer]OMD67457.1 hypothetical protein BSK50_30230 [Paenibacillus odorifer]